MEGLTTKEYNELYKKYFKEIFSKPMKELELKKKGTGKFCRLNKLGLFEYIGFFRYYHELRIEYEIISIYSYIMKDAVGNSAKTEFVDLDGEEKMKKGMKSILEEIENKVIPWFKKYEDLDTFFEEVVGNDKLYLGAKIYRYLFRATTFAKFKRYSKIQENIDKVKEIYGIVSKDEQLYRSFYEEILKEINDLEEKLQNSEVRCQWDPDRDIYGNSIGRRAIQLGIKGEAVKKYVNDWIVNIMDITDKVAEIRSSIQKGTFSEVMLPEEKKYYLVIFSNNRCCKRQRLFFSTFLYIPNN